MEFKLVRKQLSYKGLTTEAFLLIPNEIEEGTKVAIFTHGYTDHKGSIYPWASRLAAKGIPSVIFDLPGHFLGSYNDFDSFETFTENTHYLFHEAFKAILNEIDVKVGKVILGGHSLGGLMCIRAAELSEFDGYELLIIPVGFGMGAKSGVHVLETPMFKATMDARSKIISKHLHPLIFFPWLKLEKELISTSGKHIYLICGQNDGIINQDGIVRIVEILEKNGNIVTLKTPQRLYHHQPELAAVHVEIACK